jgi:predicted Zn-dependent protease
MLDSFPGAEGVEVRTLNMKWKCLILGAAACLMALAQCSAAGAEQTAAAEGDESKAFAYLCYSVGRLMEVGGALSDALVQYRRADSLDPEQCEVKAAIARTLLGLGRTDEADVVSAEVIELCPDSDEALSLRGEILVRTGKGAEAVSELAARASEPGAPGDIATLYGQALLSQGQYEEAELYLRARAETDSLDPAVAALWGRSLLLTDNADEAVRELSRASRLDPDDWRSRGMLARLLVSLDRSEEAVSILEDLVNEHEAMQSEFVALATAYSQLGESDRAHAVLDAAEAQFGEKENILLARGMAYFQEGKMDAALSTHESILELDPDSVSALNFIAYSLAEQNRDLDHALDYAKRAVRLEGDNPLVLDTLGWIYYRMGRLDDARHELETAASLGTGDPIVFEHLGDTLEALGLTDRACEAWGRALALSSDGDPVRRKLESKCSSGGAARGEASGGSQ